MAAPAGPWSWAGWPDGARLQVTSGPCIRSPGTSNPCTGGVARQRCGERGLQRRRVVCASDAAVPVMLEVSCSCGRWRLFALMTLIGRGAVRCATVCMGLSRGTVARPACRGCRLKYAPARGARPAAQRSAPPTSVGSICRPATACQLVGHPQDRNDAEHGLAGNLQIRRLPRETAAKRSCSAGYRRLRCLVPAPVQPGLVPPLAAPSDIWAAPLATETPPRCGRLPLNAGAWPGTRAFVVPPGRRPRRESDRHGGGQRRAIGRDIGGSPPRPRL